MQDDNAETIAELVREADAAREIRARREAALTPAQRLERVDKLCRELAAIRPVHPEQR